MHPEEVGQEAIIVGSYADQYGGDDRKQYKIMFCETGNTMSWKDQSQMELIEEGGEHLFDEAKIKRDEISKRNTDINYIKGNIDGGLSSESVLFLFDMLGYKSSFISNGEFYVLMMDWQKLKPVFTHIKDSKTLEEAKSVFTHIGAEMLNVKEVFDAFHN